jgi:4-hydroxy-3-methylbut-2-enyl diphosphate reductase
VDNQKATLAALNFGEAADFALVVGGFNSSNTSHLVELCQKALPTYFISGAQDLVRAEQLWHFDLSKGKRVLAEGWAALNPPQTGAVRPLRVILTSGASCPDATVDQVLQRVNQLLDGGRDVDEVFLELA